MALIDKIIALAAVRGKRIKAGPSGSNFEVRDDSDGAGPYITVWSEIELGPLPTLADGFTAEELRRGAEIVLNPPPTVPPTADELRDEALIADTDRQAVFNQIRNATPAQIKNYVNTQVTDLASARVMLRNLTLLVAMLVRR